MITSLDAIVSGMLPPAEFFKTGTTMKAAGQLHSFFWAVGLPGTSPTYTPGIAGVALTSASGQIPFTNPTGGNLSYLAVTEAASTAAGSVFICDRLWHNSAISVTTTTAQTINSVQWPARDANGLTNGTNVLVGLEVTAATTNAGAISNMSFSYTNSLGISGQTATISPSYPATPPLGTFIPFNLAAGDIGVQSIQSITLGTSLVTGSVSLVAYRILSKVNLLLANVGSSVDPITSGFVKLYNNTVPFIMFLPTGTTACNLFGRIIVTQG